MQLQNLQAYRKAVLSAFADVEKALIALQKFTLQERLQQEVVNASQQAFDVAEKQLQRWHHQPHYACCRPSRRCSRHRTRWSRCA